MTIAWSYWEEKRNHSFKKACVQPENKVLHNRRLSFSVISFLFLPNTLLSSSFTLHVISVTFPYGLRRRHRHRRHHHHQHHHQYNLLTLSELLRRILLSKRTANIRMYRMCLLPTRNFVVYPRHSVGTTALSRYDFMRTGCEGGS